MTIIWMADRAPRRPVSETRLARRAEHERDRDTERVIHTHHVIVDPVTGRDMAGAVA
jgi:hypothetical protein